MLRIGICDDNASARLTLRAALERSLEERRTEGRFFEFSSGEGLLGWLSKHLGELDLVFLDMEMRALDGMATARRLRQLDETLQLVFVTGYAEHVFDGYAVGALGYLMKPPRPEQLDGVLERAAEALMRDFDSAFICRSGETLYRIPKKSILYFASDRRQVTCVSAARTYTFYGKLDEVAQAVGNHRSLLIQSGVRVETEGLERSVYTDEKWAVFILGQLLQNAARYRGEEPVVTVSARPLGKQVQLTVADNGMGIPTHELPRVFGRGFTGSNGRARGGSTGMGLYLCKKLAGFLELGLEITSEEGRGTTVTLTFPTKEAL